MSPIRLQRLGAEMAYSARFFSVIIVFRRFSMACAVLRENVPAVTLGSDSSHTGYPPGRRKFVSRRILYERGKPITARNTG
jgi:hypothetical protein